MYASIPNACRFSGGHQIWKKQINGDASLQGLWKIWEMARRRRAPVGNCALINCVRVCC
jgi:hypothetical protein